MNIVLYAKDKITKRVSISIGIHGYIYDSDKEGETKYRPTKYISPTGYTTDKNSIKVNPIKYIDGYIVDNDNMFSIKEKIVEFILELIETYLGKDDKLYIYGSYVVTGAINDNIDDNKAISKYKEQIETKVFKDTTDFGIDNAYLCSIIGENVYGRVGGYSKDIKYTDNVKEYFKPEMNRHFMLHHTQVYYKDTTSKHKHILYGYKDEFTVGKPLGEAYYGICYLKEEIPEIAELREMAKNIQGEYSNYITIKLRILYSNRYYRLYKLFGKDVYKYIVDYPDKRDKSRRLYGIEMVDELVVISIVPPGLLYNAFKQIEVLDTVHFLLDKRKTDDTILKFKYIDITDKFTIEKTNKKGKVSIVFNRDIKGVYIPVKYGDIKIKPYIQIGTDILSQNNLGRAYKCKLLNIYLVIEQLTEKLFRYYTIVRADNESIVQCNYYSSLLYIK